ncbi:hypothetical protein ACTFSJ_27610 [Bacillus cereus group sp. MYBK12-2]|uniref:hypothetical protein n=1 Tax=Bacillus cereus group sp. MYBK12-2 TaxID=3450689 RepID=UPI0032FDA6DB|nr:hypothetical protein [Bacillus pacificus]HDR7653556.1 hypothetical protein [Bacillus pacificus]
MAANNILFSDKSILKAMRFLKNALKEVVCYPEFGFCANDRQEFYLVFDPHRGEKGEWLVFQQEGHAVDYLGDQEEENLEGYPPTGPIPGYIIWEYATKARYERYPTLLQTFKPSIIKKGNSEYLRKQLDFSGVPVIAWRLDPKPPKKP